MKIKESDDSQGVPLEELRQETEDVKIELVAVKSCNSSFGWNGRHHIVIGTECDDAWVDKADKNSQRPETYDAMRKTTEREAKDQITKQINKYARKGGRRYRQDLTWSEERPKVV